MRRETCSRIFNFGNEFTAYAHDCVYTLAIFYREMQARISAPKIYLYVVVIIVVDDNVAVVKRKKI